MPVARSKVLHAAMGAALILATHVSAHACDQTSTENCETQAQSENSDGVRRTPVERPLRPHHARHRGRAHGVAHLEEHGKAQPRSESAPAPAGDAPAKPSRSDRRFQEFLDPRSFATTEVEDWRGPMPEASHLITGTTDTAYPFTAMAPQAQRLDTRSDVVTIGASGQSDPEGQVVRVPSVATQQASDGSRSRPEELTADASPARDRGRKDELKLSHSDPDDPSNMTWVQMAFVAWGGLLTLGSALRLILG